VTLEGCGDVAGYFIDFCELKLRESDRIRVSESVLEEVRSANRAKGASSEMTKRYRKRA
jgi:hypothetical protein